MIVQINGEDRQFDRAALCVLQHLKVIHGPPEAARQDYEPAADLAFALARAAQRRLEMLFRRSLGGQYLEALGRVTWGKYLNRW